MSKVLDKLNALHQQQVDIALKEIERLARKILKANPELEGFCMAMGGASFYQKEGWYGDEDTGEFRHHVVDDGDPRIKELEDFVITFNSDFFIITGYPMKIDKWDAPVVTDW